MRAEASTFECSDCQSKHVSTIKFQHTNCVPPLCSYSAHWAYSPDSSFEESTMNFHKISSLSLAALVSITFVTPLIISRREQRPDPQCAGTSTKVWVVVEGGAPVPPYPPPPPPPMPPTRGLSSNSQPTLMAEGGAPVPPYPPPPPPPMPPTRSLSANSQPALMAEGGAPVPPYPPPPPPPMPPTRSLSANSQPALMAEGGAPVPPYPPPSKPPIAKVPTA